MTRASLLHILDHVSAISETEIRELEQLAAAFPYCQTAHVLLAKAAHDQGSMLAGQRLRRAATYAADRQLLRQLIEQPAAVATPHVAPAEIVSPTVQEQAPEAANAFIPATADATPVEEPAVEVPSVDELAQTQASEADVAEAPAALPLTAPVDLPAQDEELSALEEDEQPEPAAVSSPDYEGEMALEPSTEATVETSLSPKPTAPEGTSEAEVLLPELVTEQSKQEEMEPIFDAPEPAESVEPISGNLASNQEVISDAQKKNPEPAADELPKLAQDEAAAVEATDDDILPPVAPPIRPPVEVGSSRFEFGLGLPEPADTVVYELPVLEEDTGVIDAPVVAAPGFRGDEHIGYALGGGSRLGFCLQVADELTFALPDTAFFAPDALLHEQAPRYQPAPPPAPSPFDLINKFLRNQPRLRTPAVLPATAEEQADLSVRSTQGVPDIASESLAKIMVQQGKIHKAIEIYERLMVRQPEKKAYFADQIQQLKSTE
ncbi:hypothetical protein LGH70_17620 [Hymenobacter sp. BT635]|uniref:Tetratricopeptide repeat protein n=1 Tax=Hymenobacter nitidus TaxID=2880929 RepID=A0ABS8AIA7_9BACT|nr:hypothetical protein [Hymenobacter nitidus]MCB2379422.1 hypothetical protein [Hymenobacter nitidus]